MTWFKEAVERRTVSPFQLTQTPILSRVSGFLLSGETTVNQRKMESFKTHRNKIVDSVAIWDVYQEEQEWDHALLEFRLTISDPSVFSETPCLYGVHALCKKTRWRKAEVCQFNPDGAALSLSIPKDEVAGEVMISPFVLHSGNAGDNGWNQIRGKRLAGGFPISLLIDPPGERFGSGLELRWYAFPEDLQNSLFYLDLDSESPLLLINKRHPGLKTIFEDRSKTGARSNIRNSLFSFIAVDVWMQLTQFAGELAKLELDDDQDSKVILSRKVIRSLSRMLDLREDEILHAASDATERSRLHRLLQHHFRLAGYQDALVSGFIEGAAL